MSNKIILGSQSPRRRELLAGLIGEEAFDVLPPLSDEEQGFDGLTEAEDIEQRLARVTGHKAHDVHAQVNDPECIVICADTIVVAGDSSQHVVLGKPPQRNWQSTVRQWFRNYYVGRSHGVWTGLQVGRSGQQSFKIVKTSVTIPHLDDEVIDWYVATGEPVGKAGGYGIQGQAAALISGVQGSLTNVIGLPMLELRQILTGHGLAIPEHNQPDGQE